VLVPGLSVTVRVDTRSAAHGAQPAVARETPHG
jgi:hypothetical protein